MKSDIKIFSDRVEYYFDSVQITVCSNGTKEWFFHGQFHRENGPAVEYSDGTKCWCINGQYHREDGPAFEFSSGTKYWFIKGKKYSFDEYLRLIPKEGVEKLLMEIIDYV